VQSVANGDAALDVVGAGDHPGLFQADVLREVFPEAQSEQSAIGESVINVGTTRGFS
jgi:hypothetical protein